MKTLKFLTLIIYCFTLQSFATNEDEINEELRRLIERAAVIGKPIVIGDEAVISRHVLPRFYEQRNFEMAWRKKKDVDELLEAISNAHLEGLRAEDYHLEMIKHYRAMKNRSAFERAEYDILLSDAFLIYGSHLLSGKVNPETLNAEWKADRREADMAAVLENTLKERSVSQSLEDLKPKYKAYERLKRSLVMYRDIEKSGGWQLIPAGETLEPGMEDERILPLRKRLSSTGDLPIYKVQNELLFDEKLEEAVKKFQRRHGLTADGAIGPNTLSILNTSVYDRIEKLIVNLERCRWLPQDLGEHYILTNIANFELELVRKNEIELEMDVIVGKEFRKTPVFSSRMTYLVLNPTWTIPPTILANDVLPAIKKDISYLSKNRMKIISGSGSREVEVDPSTIDWLTITAKNFPYMIRQEPGTHNALGAVKFMFPNTYNVYLHDTNRKDLFDKTDRALSSGCIRVSKPIDLTTHLLKDDPKWDRKKIEAAIASGKTQTIMLPQPVNVHLLYWTAYMDENELINFRKDIYERDQNLLRALRETHQPL